VGDEFSLLALLDGKGNKRDVIYLGPKLSFVRPLRPPFFGKSLDFNYIVWLESI
jgi:hypothetical protein